MDYNKSDNPEPDVFGAGKDGFRDNNGAGQRGSLPRATEFNAVWGELIAAVESWGLTLSAGDRGQLAEALGDGVSGWFGDGSDGDLVVSAGTPITLTGDKYYNDVTLNDNLNTAGFRVFVNGVLTLNAGHLQNVGTAGSGAANGTGGPEGTLGSGTNGGAGGGGIGSAGTNVTNSAGAIGGAGGAGGSGGGAAAGTWAAPAAALGRFRDATAMRDGQVRGVSGGAATATLLRGGSGGGGGSGDGGNNGGGGGGGGGIVVVCARRIVFAGAGKIRADGGAGASVAAGNAGGGGGGGGGAAFVLYRTQSGLVVGTTVTAAGGAKGLKSGTGDNGSDGTAGSAIAMAI